LVRLINISAAEEGADGIGHADRGAEARLDEFLTGERTLRSDVLDRPAAALGYVLQPKG